MRVALDVKEEVEKESAPRCACQAKKLELVVEVYRLPTNHPTLPRALPVIDIYTPGTHKPFQLSTQPRTAQHTHRAREILLNLPKMI